VQVTFLCGALLALEKLSFSKCSVSMRAFDVVVLEMKILSIKVWVVELIDECTRCMMM